MADEGADSESDERGQIEIPDWRHPGTQSQSALYLLSKASCRST